VHHSIPLIEECPGCVGVEHKANGIAEQHLCSHTPVEPSEVRRVSEISDDAIITTRVSNRQEIWMTSIYLYIPVVTSL
jgi:hypothetical protein